jgi:hypothetical protein
VVVVVLVVEEVFVVDDQLVEVTIRLKKNHIIKLIK